MAHHPSRQISVDSRAQELDYRIAGAGSGATFPEASGKAMAGIELTIPNGGSCAEFEEWAAPPLEQ